MEIVGRSQMTEEQYQEEEEEAENGGGGGLDISTAVSRFYGWPSSRIVRVSRACGGKDRHSKVLTSKGLRDRRVRLSVNTAIQFYDLQDRLGYDQPSKAVEWLLKAAASSIDELPPMSILFTKHLSEEKPATDSPEVEMEDGGAGATSEACKGSGLSISRSGRRIKARERVAEKEKKASSLNPISQTTSFTELLNGGTNTKHWSSSPMDYFSTGIPLSANFTSMGSGFPPSELQQFSFPPENLVQAIGNSSNMNPNQNGSGDQYNMSGSFSVSSSSCFAGFNRGTLQSNSSSSPSLLPHIQRFSDGSPPSFFTTVDNNSHHNQFVAGYETRLQQRGKN